MRETDEKKNYRANIVLKKMQIRITTDSFCAKIWCENWFLESFKMFKKKKIKIANKTTDAFLF